jgi:uncharacterized membrane protein YgaE (UPF0421/DUF939 family)
MQQNKMNENAEILKRIRNGILGAIIGGGTAYMLMYNSGDVSWIMLVLIAMISFVAAYIAGNKILTWIAKLDEYLP